VTAYDECLEYEYTCQQIIAPDPACEIECKADLQELEAIKGIILEIHSKYSESEGTFIANWITIKQNLQPIYSFLTDFKKNSTVMVIFLTNLTSTD
jgi:hypothetical protein